MLEIFGKDLELSLENFEKVVIMMIIFIGDWIEIELLVESLKVLDLKIFKKVEFLMYVIDYLR